MTDREQDPAVLEPTRDKSRGSVARTGIYAATGGILLFLFAVLVRDELHFRSQPPSQQIVGGPLSFIAYALVTWAFTQAPIALVSALRETSLVFALIIGTLFLKERINLAKIVSVFVTLSGAVLLRLQS